ncbi:hypothetical protein MOQ_000054 [Trypanosoma cruzi marinkellei]|uniref:N-acetyltransferase domain-containing protein n=1 Tax=Trypanosoma cruzi marinkellei TaxID=85056 RepID=K2NJW3_TRYCR|nr:hypothetical protein MOQ_000054 [Trypanosoma cruzi marinkellei]
MNNEHVLVSGSRLRLVPYLAQHVLRYHQWMGDSELMRCTASERLTLEEEYENQRDWLCAEDKLTFIILAPLSIAMDKAVREKRRNNAFGKNPALRDVHDDDERGGEAEDVNEVEGGDQATADVSHGSVEGEAPRRCTSSTTARLRRLDEVCIVANTHPNKEEKEEKKEEHCIGRTYVMVGDCNLYCVGINEAVELMGEEDAYSNAHGKCFELGVMIADYTFRRQGIAEEAVRLLMSYAMDKLCASCFIAKILNTNTSSIRFFTLRLGFTFLKEVCIFNELHFIKRFADAAEREAWMAGVAYTVGVYDANTEKEMTVLHSVPDATEWNRERMHGRIGPVT